MPTPAEDAFSEGFSALAEAHGKTWTFGSVSFTGWASPLRDDDPRLQQGTGVRLMELRTTKVFSTYPAKGDDLVSAGKRYRVTAKPVREPSGELVILLAV